MFLVSIPFLARATTIGPPKHRLLSGIMRRRLEEIKQLEKEVAKLESMCLASEI